MPVPATPSRFQRYVAVLSRWLFVFGMVFVLAKLAGDYVTTHWLPQYYRATVEMEIIMHEVPNPTLSQSSTEKFFDPAAFQEQLSILQSSDLMLPTIHDLSLNEAWAKRLFKKEEGLSDEEALAYLKNSVRFEAFRATNVIKITITDDNAKEAAEIANAITDRYKKMRDDEQTQRNNRGLDALKKRIAEQKKAVDDAKAAVDKEREKLATPGVDIPGGQMPLNGLVELREHELDKKKEELLHAEEDYDARKVLLDKIINLPDDQFVASLKGINRYPNIAFDSANPSEYKNKVAEVRRAMEVDTDMAKSRVNLLQNQVNTLIETVRQETTQELVPYVNAERQLDKQQSLLDALNVRLKQDQADIALEQSPVRIISRAEVPTKPDHRMAPMLTLIGSGILALMAASFVEMVLLFQRAGERGGNG
jgi:uncharacterized protein involved in exopolysaccharide biosynthesis